MKNSNNRAEDVKCHDCKKMVTDAEMYMDKTGWHMWLCVKCKKEREHHG